MSLFFATVQQQQQQQQQQQKEKKKEKKKTKKKKGKKFKTIEVYASNNDGKKGEGGGHLCFLTVFPIPSLNVVFGNQKRPG